jgi:hypothetical protein
MSLSQVATYAAIAFGGLIASMLIALVRNVMAIKVLNNGVFAILAAPFVLAGHGFHLLIYGLNTLVDWLKGTLSPSRDSVTFWDITGPLLYFIFFVVLVAGDAYLAVITLPQLFGGGRPNLNPELLVPASAVMWVTIFLTIAGVTADLFHVTKFLRPYTEATGQPQRWLRLGALISMGLLVVAAVLFGIFRALLANLVSNGLVDGLLDIVFFVLLTIATAAAALAILHSVLAAIVFGASMIKLGARVLTYPTSIVVNMLDKVAELVVGIYDVPARIGESLWNYLSQLTANKPWRVGRIPQFQDRQFLGDVIRAPRV